MLPTDKALWKVDNGLLRLNEAEDVQKTLEGYLKIQLTVVDAKKRFLDALSRVQDPERKRNVSLDTDFRIPILTLLSEKSLGACLSRSSKKQRKK